MRVHAGFVFYQFADAGGEVTEDLQFRLAFPPKEGSVDFLCGATPSTLALIGSLGVAVEPC